MTPEERWGDTFKRSRAKFRRHGGPAIPGEDIGTLVIEHIRAAVAEARKDHRGCVQDQVALMERLAEARKDKAVYLDKLDDACSIIDSYGFRSDDYGGTDDLSSCIHKLGKERDEARKDTERLRGLIRLAMPEQYDGIWIGWYQGKYVVIGGGVVSRARPNLLGSGGTMDEAIADTIMPAGSAPAAGDE